MPPNETPLDAWFRVTNWHGTIHVCNSNNILIKFIWVSIIFGGCFLAINHSTGLILEYINHYKFLTSIKYERPPGGLLDWPNISVCSSNTVNNWIDLPWSPYDVAMITSPKKESIAFYDRFQAESPYIYDNDTELENVFNERFRNYSDKLQSQTKSLSSFTQIFHQFFRNCNSTVIDCGTNYEFLSQTNNDCCLNTSSGSFGECFYIYPTETFGKCCESGSWAKSAIYYIFNYHFDDIYHSILLNEKPSAGLRLELYFGELHQSEPLIFLLAPGSHSKISLVPQIYRTIDRRLRAVQFTRRTRMCKKSPANYVYIDSNAYSKRLCKLDCDIQLSMHICNCTIHSTPLKKGWHCIGKYILDCTEQWRYVKELWKKKFDDKFIYGDCLKSCVDACENKVIDGKLSTASFPSISKLKALRNTFIKRNLNYSDQELKELILFEMYYEAREYRVIERLTRTTFEELLSNIGGAFGVYTGLSLLSIFQCFVYIGKTFLAWHRQNRFYDVG